MSITLQPAILRQALQEATGTTYGASPEDEMAMIGYVENLLESGSERDINAMATSVAKLLGVSAAPPSLEIFLES